MTDWHRFELSEDALFLMMSLTLLGVALATLAVMRIRARGVRAHRFWLLERNRRLCTVFTLTLGAGFLGLIYRAIHYLCIHYSLFAMSGLAVFGPLLLLIVLQTWRIRKRRSLTHGRFLAPRKRVR